MFARQSLQVRRLLNLRCNCMLKRNTQQATQSNVLNNNNVYFAPHIEKKPEIEPVLKNLLLGQFEKKVLDFPVTQTSMRYKDFVEWLKPIENYVASCAESDKKLDKSEVLANLRELNVFLAHLDEANNGLNLSETESLKLIETLSALPWLGTYMVKNHILPVRLISQYGSESQKLKYYPGIVSGEVTPTICIKEGDNGTNINNIQTQLVEHVEEGFYLLNGEKSFVINGTDSNLFLVFAKDLTGNAFDSTAYSLVAVERGSEGMTFSNVYETIGRHEVPVCTVRFDNILIPKANVIGEVGGAFDSMMDLLKPGKQNVAAQAISILRNFMQQLAADVLEMKHFDRNFHEFHAVKKALGEMVFALYTMESMTYLTSGLADVYEEHDVELERIITEKYCANKCLDCIQAGLQLMGAQGFLSNTTYIQAFHDALALTTMDTNNIDANVYVAMVALKHTGRSISQRVYKKRNPAIFPIFNLKEDWLGGWFQKDIGIANNLHPSLRFGGNYLEECTQKLQNSVFKLLDHHGNEIIKQQIDLARMTEMLTEIYTIIANLSRASRSYSIGLRNATTEKDMAVCMAYVSMRRVCMINEDIGEGDLANGDYVHKNNVNLTYEQREYPMEHPLSRTF